MVTILQPGAQMRAATPRVGEQWDFQTNFVPERAADAVRRSEGGGGVGVGRVREMGMGLGS